MGTMEKAGIAVIAVLIGIIVVVGILNKKDLEPTENTGVASSAGEAGRGEPVRSPAVVTRETDGGIAPVDGSKTAPVVKNEDAPKTDGDASGTKVDFGAGGEPKSPVEEGGGGADLARVTGFPRTYTIKPGDVLTKIAFREYGTHKMAKYIELENKLDPKALRQDATITLPVPPEDLMKEVAAAQAQPSITPSDVIAGGAAAKSVSGAVNAKKSAPVGKTASKKSGRPSFITDRYRSSHLRRETPAGKVSTKKSKK